ncbi:MAG: class I SAM-dependent methyltransferase [Pseudomonadota bacterium]
MSRLESFRRRLTAQIEGLNWAMAQTADIAGDILELGLGNGRTYSHLREYGNRRVWAVDQVLQCHPNSTPPQQDFLHGDAGTMMQKLLQEGRTFGLIHSDLGNGNKEMSAQLHIDLSPLIAALAMPGGLVVSQEPLVGLTQIDGPASVPAERYNFYRRTS